MENAEELQLVLERYSRLKPKEIPEALEEYMGFVAKTGDTVFKWPLIQHLFREKLMNVITDFHDNGPSITDLSHYPNVDPFNFDLMKKNLIERMETFSAAPFTIQRICELLTEPRKQYSRLDKFMRAIEKNILVVSTTEPGRTRHESENGESLDSTINGDLMSEGQLDVGSSEEDQNISETPLLVQESPNGTTTEQTESQTVDPLAAVDNPDIDVPLEKLEPEVNVLTIESNEVILKSVVEESASDDSQTETAQSVTDTSATTESVLEIKVCAEVAPETDVNIAAISEEPKSTTELAPTEASPAKRLIEVEENGIPVDEIVTKKVKIDNETPEENTETIPTDATPTNSTEAEILVVPQTTEAVSHVETNEPTEAAAVTETVAIETSPTEVQTSLILDTTTPTIEEQQPIQPLPPIETIVQETTMEQQVVMTNPVDSVVATEDEDSMKVDATPLVSAENKMQTDDVDETAASAMDVDECSTDFIME